MLHVLPRCDPSSSPEQRICQRTNSGFAHLKCIRSNSHSIITDQSSTYWPSQADSDCNSQHLYWAPKTHTFAQQSSLFISNTISSRFVCDWYVHFLDNRFVCMFSGKTLRVGLPIQMTSSQKRCCATKRIKERTRDYLWYVCNCWKHHMLIAKARSAPEPGRTRSKSTQIDKLFVFQDLYGTTHTSFVFITSTYRYRTFSDLRLHRAVKEISW